MITKRLGLLAGIVALALGIVTLLPKSAAQPVGLRLTDGKPMLPERVMSWEGRDQPITEKEITVLGPGTQFARKLYLKRAVKPYRIWATIVLSGRDISNSIHRPERCLDAQGWEVRESEELEIAAAEKRGLFPVRRLHNFKTDRNNDGTAKAEIEAYTYYWFVGEHAVTASHWGRYLTDNRDRIFRGVDQRWAFLTITAEIPPERDPMDQAEMRRQVDKEMREFLKYLSPSVHGDSVSID